MTIRQGRYSKGKEELTKTLKIQTISDKEKETGQTETKTNDLTTSKGGRFYHLHEGAIFTISTFRDFILQCKSCK